MLKTFRASKSNVVVWALLGLLILGLAGFGISTGAGGSQAVAQVGDAEVGAEEYTRALDQELRAISQQIGRALPMSEARQFGVDRTVLARLLSDATLDDEARRLGLSTGDERVHEMVVATPAFSAVDGAFDREAYVFSLERAGLTPARFEEMLRAEATREMIASGVQAAAAMPPMAGETILGYLGETRSFDWLALDADLLETPAPAAGAAALDAYHAAHQDRYTRPETRRIAYALLDPAALAATIDVSEEELRAAYEAASDRFQTPERRITDRIGFGTPEEAAAAKARLDAGEIDFDALAAERGLSEAEIDQGAQARRDLSEQAAQAVFGAAGPGLVGPVATALGPSLYRINAIIAATSTPFEEAREELRAERALERAGARISEEAAPVDDMIAGGARIEEIAQDTLFEAGTLALDAETAGPLAEDPAFRDLAENATTGQETDLAELASGGLVTLRVDAVEPPAPIPLEEIRDRVAADWSRDETTRLLSDLAARHAAELEAGLPFADLAARLGREAQRAGPFGRTDLLPEAPAGLVEAVFAAPEAGVVRVAGDGRVALAQVAQVTPFDPDAPEAAPLVESVQDQLDTQLADDVLSLHVQALETRLGITLNQPLIEQVLARFP